MNFKCTCILWIFNVYVLTRVHGDTCSPTPSDQLGPFHMLNTPRRSTVCTESDPQFYSDQLTVSGYVKGTNCQGVGSVMVEIWQADSSGQYDPQVVGDYSTISWDFTNPSSTQDYTCRSTVDTDSTGAYSFTTVMPGYYPNRPRHLHLRLTSSSETSVHQMYFDSDDRNGKIASLTVKTEQVMANVKNAVFNFTIGVEGTYDLSASGSDTGSSGNETGNNGNNTIPDPDPPNTNEPEEKDLTCYSCEVCPEPFDVTHSSVRLEQCPPHGCRAWKNKGFNHWSRGCLLTPECQPDNAAYTAICCETDKCLAKTSGAATYATISFLSSVLIAVFANWSLK